MIETINLLCMAGIVVFGFVLWADSHSGRPRMYAFVAIFCAILAKNIYAPEYTHGEETFATIFITMVFSVCFLIHSMFGICFMYQQRNRIRREWQLAKLDYQDVKRHPFTGRLPTRYEFQFLNRFLQITCPACIDLVRTILIFLLFVCPNGMAGYSSLIFRFKWMMAILACSWVLKKILERKALNLGAKRLDKKERMFFVEN